MMLYAAPLRCMGGARMGELRSEHGSLAEAETHERDTLLRATILSAAMAGEGLRALALAWLGISLGVLAATPLLGPQWWIGVILTAMAAAVGLAYWWVVPAPFGHGEASLNSAVARLHSTMALSDAATWWTMIGLLIATAVTVIGVVTTDAPPMTKGVVLAGCLIAALLAIRWARSRFVWHQAVLDSTPKTATVLYNGRLFLPWLQRLSAEMAVVRALECPLVEQEQRLIGEALGTTSGHVRERLLTDLLAVHARRSRLMGVHDFSRLSARDLFAVLPSYLQREERVTPAWMVPRAWLWMLRSAPFNVMLWLLVGTVNGHAKLDHWQALPSEQFDDAAKSKTQARAALTEVLEAADTPEVKRMRMEEVLEWSGSTKSESRDLELLLEEWFG